MHNNALGCFVRRTRKLRALSQQEVADAAGVDVNTIRKVEAGGNGGGFNLGTLDRIATVLRIPLERMARVASRGRP